MSGHFHRKHRWQAIIPAGSQAIVGDYRPVSARWQWSGATAK
ncbi:hypothetical protein [Pseudomonas sp. EZ-C24]|nr:hypothetical protein [Pseudomonas sp. EZ-C24]